MAHPGPRRLSIPAMALTLAGVLALTGLTPSSDGPDPWGRLRSLPPEVRSHLADQLKAFDLLSRAEQDAIRALDRQVASEPEEARATDYTVLRRYHLWVQSLPEAQRIELTATPPAGRLSLVTKFLADGKAREKSESWLRHYADFGGVSPFDLAARIGAWQKLTTAQKAELAKLPQPDLVRRMGQYVRELKIQVERPSASESEAIYKRGLESGRFPFLKKAEETKKQANVKHRFIDNSYFLEHPPKKVDPEKLLAFEQSLPVWIRAGFDALPPEETRRRLTILYRLLNPRDEVKAPAPGATPPPPSPRPKVSAPMPVPPAPTAGVPR